MTKTLQPYDFEELKRRFETMSNQDIMQEYAELTLRRNELMKWDVFDEFLKLIEDVDNARDYLGHYIAMLYCGMNGYL